MFFFFFSSRRRHTRFDCDWSSDVCSSDLVALDSAARTGLISRMRNRLLPALPVLLLTLAPSAGAAQTTLQLRWELVGDSVARSEEHTSELQSQSNLVCRLLLEKKKKKSSNGTLN